MRTMNENFGGNEYPPMKLPKQENATSSFEEKCNGLVEIISRSFDFFMWYAGLPKCRRYELCSTVFWECLFLQMLAYIHETDDMRGRLLLDERLEVFLKILKMLNDQMRTGRTFISSSNGILVDDTKDGTSCFTEARRETVEGFREHTEWLKVFCIDDGNRARANALADKLQLNYPMKKFACMGDDFDQHANMAFNGLMMLAIPSMVDYSEEQFAQVFQDSIDMFRKGSSWLAAEAQLEEEIEQNLKDANCDSYSAKMARVKDLWWGPTKTAIRVLLGKFGITYVNVLSQSYKGQMGRQLYERLNGIRIDKYDNSPLIRMTNDDLCRYFKLESDLQLCAAKIEKYRLLVSDPMPQDDYFEPEQPRLKIRNALNKTIHERGDGNREVLWAQSHWFAVHKVFEYHQMCCGTLKDFNKVMNDWFPTAPTFCDYDSLKNMKVPDIRQKCYTEWSAATPANVPYRRVALTLAKYLREEGLID